MKEYFYYMLNEDLEVAPNEQIAIRIDEENRVEGPTKSLKSTNKPFTQLDKYNMARTDAWEKATIIPILKTGD